MVCVFVFRQQEGGKRSPLCLTVLTPLLMCWGVMCVFNMHKAYICYSYIYFIGEMEMDKDKEIRELGERLYYCSDSKDGRKMRKMIEKRIKELER